MWRRVTYGSSTSREYRLSVRRSRYGYTSAPSEREDISENKIVMSTDIAARTQEMRESRIKSMTPSDPEAIAGEYSLCNEPQPFEQLCEIPPDCGYPLNWIESVRRDQDSQGNYRRETLLLSRQGQDSLTRHKIEYQNERAGRDDDKHECSLELHFSCDKRSPPVVTPTDTPSDPRPWEQTRALGIRDSPASFSSS